MDSISFTKPRRLAGFAALLTLLFLLPACSKDNGDSSGDSSTTTGLKISLGGISEGGAESLEKSALASETVTQKLDSDMTVEYTLAPTAASLTRSTTAMTPGVKYRVLVYTSAGTYVAYQDYTAGSESSTATIPLSTGTYKVLAYSYNTSVAITDDATAASLSVTTGKDLLYYSSTVNVVDGTSNPVSITFTHWFSKVTVAVSASTLGASITAISGVTLSPTYASASVNLFSGATTSGSTSSQSVSISAGAQTLTATTMPVFAATGTSSFSVGITSLKLGSSTIYNNLSMAFSKTLTAGYTYTLTANLKNNFIIGGVRWATGNLRYSSGTYSFYTNQESYSGVWNGGDYFCWDTLDPTATSSSNTTTGVYNSSTDPCMKVAAAGSWRMPTYSDIASLANSGTAAGTYSTKAGRFFKTTAVPSNANKPNYLFLPIAGGRDIGVQGMHSASPSTVWYWASTPSTASEWGNRAFSLFFTSTSIVAYHVDYVSYGWPIRCVHDL